MQQTYTSAGHLTCLMGFKHTPQVATWRVPVGLASLHTMPAAPSQATSTDGITVHHGHISPSTSFRPQAAIMDATHFLRLGMPTITQPHVLQRWTHSQCCSSSCHTRLLAAANGRCGDVPTPTSTQTNRQDNKGTQAICNAITVPRAPKTQRLASHTSFRKHCKPLEATFPTGPQTPQTCKALDPQTQHLIAPFHTVTSGRHRKCIQPSHPPSMDVYLLLHHSKLLD